MSHLPTHMWKGPPPPVKEGRSKYSARTPFSQARLPWHTILRATGMAAAIVVIVWLLRPSYPPSSVNVTRVASPTTDLRAAVSASSSRPEKSAAGSQTTDRKIGAAPNGKQKPLEFHDDERFEAALRNLVRLHPGESAAHALLAPIDVSGHERMREVGTRSREYKKYLEAWEKVHMSTSGEIRDDVVQYLRAHPDYAKALSGSVAEAIRAYEIFRHFLWKLGNVLFPWTAPYHGDHMALHAHIRGGGKGIVLTGGNGQASYMLTNIHSFRALGCDLPIEIMYLGDGDLNKENRADLEALPGVVTRDLSLMVSDEGWHLAGWAAKPFAILLSSFREVIFIDADALFFKDPSVLLNEPAYIETGTLFFKDRVIFPENKSQFLKKVLPEPLSKSAKESRYWTGLSGHAQESGVVVVDKWKHLIPLLVVTRMNGPDRDGNKAQGITGVYDLVYGDKETFWLSWELAGELSYAFHGGGVGVMGIIETAEEKEARMRKKGKKGSDVPSESNTICAPQLVHFDLHGKPLWFNGWVVKNKFTDQGKFAVGTFDVYIEEPAEVKEPWDLQDDNVACLTGKKATEFSREEKKVLEMIIERARTVEASHH